MALPEVIVDVLKCLFVKPLFRNHFRLQKEIKEIYFPFTGKEWFRVTLFWVDWQSSFLLKCLRVARTKRRDVASFLTLFKVFYPHGSTFGEISSQNPILTLCLPPSYFPSHLDATPSMLLSFPLSRFHWPLLPVVNPFPNPDISPGDK